jgi:cell division protein FtsW
MIISTSIPIAYHLHKDLFFFIKREILYVLITLIISFIILGIPICFWNKNSNILLLSSILSLLIVLLIGTPINGSSRWLKIGMLHIQPAEIAKLTLFFYLSTYLEKKEYEICNHFWAFIKPIGILTILSILLLAQPDLGTIIIFFITSLSILFLSGAKLWQFLIIIISSVIIILNLIITEPYRLQRMLSFWHPWKDPFGNSYQLTQSLMALSRGKILGEGLGNAVQKLEYLPQSHTDFIFSIIGEECGYIGTSLILLILFFISFRAMYISQKAFKSDQKFSGFLACALAIWFNSQTLINISVTSGILPTKGLTLPFISYGGSSLIMFSIAIMLILRIDFEIRLKKAQAFSRRLK